MYRVGANTKTFSLTFPKQDHNALRPRRMSGGSVTTTNTNVSSKDRSSVAGSLPFELVETILLQLDVPEMLLAAAHLPNFWRSVIENSTYIGQKLRQYGYLDGTNSIMQALLSTTFKYSLPGGMLFVHCDILGNEGLVLASPTDRTGLKVLTPRGKVQRLPGTGRNGRASIKLFDFEGQLLCTKKFVSDGRFVLWQYFRG